MKHAMIAAMFCKAFGMTMSAIASCSMGIVACMICKGSISVSTEDVMDTCNAYKTYADMSVLYLAMYAKANKKMINVDQWHL